MEQEGDTFKHTLLFAVVLLLLFLLCSSHSLKPAFGTLKILHVSHDSRNYILSFRLWCNARCQVVILIQWQTVAFRKRSLRSRNKIVEEIFY